MGISGSRLYAFAWLACCSISSPPFLISALCMRGIPILALYNGRRGKKTKAGGWFFYVYYPAHLLVLYLVKLLSRAILPL
ncbi:MAG: hypothetical protein HFE88_08500 [Acutalibacter sp.]|nr:hypothetical protein [Acutalibacter sp.]